MFTEERVLEFIVMHSWPVGRKGDREVWKGIFFSQAEASVCSKLETELWHGGHIMKKTRRALVFHLYLEKVKVGDGYWFLHLQQVSILMDLHQEWKEVQETLHKTFHEATSMLVNWKRIIRESHWVSWFFLSKRSKRNHVTLLLIMEKSSLQGG